MHNAFKKTFINVSKVAASKGLDTSVIDRFLYYNCPGTHFSDSSDTKPEQTEQTENIAEEKCKKMATEAEFELEKAELIAEAEKTKALAEAELKKVKALLEELAEGVVNDNEDETPNHRDPKDKRARKAAIQK